MQTLLHSADKNKLDTGTLGFSDINNKAEYRVEQQSAGFSSGGDIGGQLISNTGSALLAGVNNKGKGSNTTQSAVAEGEIVVRDQESQKQDVDDLSRDTDNAHKKLDTIFDKEAEQKRIARNQLLGEIGQQITDIGVTGARIKATEDARNAKEADREAARKVLESEKKNSDPAAVNDYLIQQSINDSGWGVGGDYARLVDAGTALTQGLANGDINSAVANASAPYIANAIGRYVDGKPGKLAAHAIANVALALAKDENALSQASGAVTAEAMGMLSLELYNKRPGQLTEEEKSTLSAFASLAAGIAGGLSGGSLSDAGNAAQAGKNTIENNAFGKKDEKPVQIIPIMPLPNVLDANGDPMVVGGSVGKVPGKVTGKETAGKSSGAENAATSPKLKGDLVQQNLNNIAKQDPRLAIAINGDGSGKKDFSMGNGSRAEADRLGKIWVGDGAKQTSGGGWISADGTRGYRLPASKDSPFATTGTQANFETYKLPTDIGKQIKPEKIGNGHLNILD